MRITQCHISPSLALFKKGFMERWGLSDYESPFQPTLFVGCYHYADDILKINAHRGLKLILFGGADIPNIQRLDLRGLHLVVDSETYRLAPLLHRLSPKQFLRIPFKDYSDLKPIPLGDKIYCYQAGETEAHQKKYRRPMLQEIIEHYGQDNVLLGIQGHTMQEVVKKFYEPSFINLQFNPLAGFTTAIEMAHMGRLTVSNHKAPFCLPFETTDDVIKHIDSVRTNRLTADVSGFLHDSDDWLHTEFWL
ncbi:MAG: hypothetical protein DIU61_008700 [Bacteroidota bacterium]